MNDIPIVMLVVFIGILLYLMPAFIAARRHHHQQWPIFFVNLLVGWTALGWLVALVWSVSAVKPELSSELTQACPACAETIKKAAKVCRYCRTDLAAA